jgi:serine protease AprX
MRQFGGTRRGESRTSALWGTGKGKDGSRARTMVTTAFLAFALVLPTAGLAGRSNSGPGNGNAFIPKGLLDKAKQSGNQKFQVIIQMKAGNSAASAGAAVRGNSGHVYRELESVRGVAATLSGRAIEALSRNPNVLAITIDAPVSVTLGEDPLTSTLDSTTSSTSDSSGTSGSDSTSDSSGTSGSDSTSDSSGTSGSDSTSDSSGTSGSDSTSDSSGTSGSGSLVESTTSTVANTTETISTVFAPPPQDAEMWRRSTQVDMLWAQLDPYTGMVLGSAPQAPAIAIVDSGIDASRVEDFGGRVVASVNLSSLTPSATGDDQGHGTMVAGVAAGQSATHPGVAQNAPIVSIRVSDANGMSMSSDVIAAADWILANKDAFNIRVANFSLKGSVETTYRFDPLNKAVQALWLNGVVVVAAAGNHGAADGSAVSMSYAPGNDPFVITVGASDELQTADPLDNGRPSWSGYGVTMDGFHKPEVSAPGRYMVMPVPESSTIARDFAGRMVEPGYIWMSGTSFATPIVSGIAAQLLALHPAWTPDQVKGALMLTANYLGGPGFAAGVGQVDALWAGYGLGEDAPDANENYGPFILTDSVTGQKFFDEASWTSYVEGAASWSSASWSSASWSSASWSSASWSSASWSSASWTSSVDTQMSSQVTESESSDVE